MTAAEFRTTLAEAGLTQAAFAGIVGYTPTSISRYCCGLSPVPSWCASWFDMRGHLEECRDQLRARSIYAG